ncbi:acyltransferase family protein [Dongia rigui]|uniref:Acyltransferase n=1 Tax=Dongia rigui TaxID=940149 RepID=A0ABU5E027_9PROT|nr:acyltransferase [Dongia rigui]MDY0872890.1 acyltransferase [Dongia rigui]
MVKHVPHFEVLRGIAAMWVLCGHALRITDIHASYLSRGDQAVEVFVILSGFVIALMRVNEAEPYGRYIFRRFMRLYPLFLVALVLGALTMHLYAPVFGSSPWLAQEQVAFLARMENAENGLFAHIALHLTMLHGVVPDTVLPQAALMFSGPLWSISLEWQFYLIAPFLIALISFNTPRGVVIAGLILLATIGLQWVTAQYWVAGVPSFLPLRLPLFVVGIASALLWHRARAAKPWVLAVVLGLATVAGWSFAPNKLPILIWFTTYFLAATHDRIGLSRVAGRVVAWPAARFLGRVSYGVYVLHVPVMMAVTYYLVIPLVGDQPAIVAALMILGLTLPIVLVLATLSFTYIERPAIAWARGRASHRANASAPQSVPEPSP